MKSFFKKLAFVMALAMVVSLAAPAAASAAVEGWEDVYLCEQYDETEAPIVDVTLTEGESMDFRFIGAPSNWRDYAKRGWKIVETIDGVTATADPTKARVSNTGLVRVYAEGIYEVQYRAEGEVVASATINVVPEEVVPTTPVDPVPTTPDVEPTTPVEPDPTTPVEPDPTTPVEPDPTTPVEPEPVNPLDSITYAQLTDKKVSFTFAADVDYKTTDVTLYYLIPLISGDPFELPWNCTVNVNGAVVTLTVPETFEDGKEFRVKFGTDAVQNFVTEINAVDTVEITTPNGKTSIFASDLENGEDGETLTFGYVLKAGSVDLTDYYKNNEVVDYDVRYELVSPVEGSELMESVDFSDEGTLAFSKANIEAVVRPIYVYATDDGEKEIPGMGVKITSKQYEPWSLNNEVVDWCLVKEGTAEGKADWNKKSIAADESEYGEYKIVLRFKDSHDVEYVTDAAGKTDRNYVVMSVDDKITEAGYSFKFFSGNTDFMLVTSEDSEDEEAGEISVYKQGSCYYYVARYIETEETDGPVLDAYIHAAEIVVDPARYLARIEVTDSVTAYADALDDFMDLCETEVSIKSFDQNGIEWHGKDKNEYDVTSTNETVNTLIKTYGLAGIGIEVDDANHKIHINGNTLYEAVAKKITTFKFTVTEKGSKKTDTFTLSLTAPEYGEDGEIELDQVTSTTYGDYDKVDVVVEAVDLIADDSVPGGANDYAETDQFATITLYKLSGGVRVGKYTEEVASGEKIEHTINIVGIDDLTEGKWVVPTTREDVAPGERWLVVYDPDGDVVTNVEWNAAGDAIQFQLAETNDDGSMKYADLGDYTVKVYTFRFSAKGKNYNPPISKTIKVTNSTEAKVSFVGKIGTGSSTSDDIKQVVIDALKFNLNGSEWKASGNNKELTADLISNVEYISRDGYVIIKKVTFKVPTDRKNADLPWNEASVDVNVSVEADVAPAEVDE